MATDASFSQHQLAALLASKLYFNLGDFERSIDFALLAGAAFDVHEASEYVETILARTVDRYIEARRKEASIDPVLEAVVEKMVEKCMQAGEVRQVAGIAVEANRMDVLKAVLSCGVDAAYYAAELAMRFVGPSALRNEILALVIAALQASDNPDYVFIADCLTARQDAARCAELLAQLRGTDGALHAQVAYNIVEAASPSTLSQLHADLHAFKAQTDKFRLTFLYRTNASDMLILERTRDALLATSSMHHTALSTANALMHAGTTCDAFLRKNLDWLAQANNWSKFSATASLGVIHRGQRDARALLESYLPAEGVAFGASEYSEGGALFALGLINDDESVQYLRNALDAGSEVVQHGAMLGLGAARMASGDAELGDQLRSILYRDNATSGEAAAFGLGLIYAGHLDVALIDDLLAYAHETQHDKVIRACALAIALTCYGHGDKAEGTQGRMLEDKDALIRHGGAWAVALAYAGTSSNRGIRRLLHLAVSDASDDVRRAAVIGLGLVLFRTPGELPVLLDLLIESYNPHVRYGAAMALGIAFAGTGNAAAIEMIAPLAKDMSDFVRQASHISLALLHQQRLTDASAEHRKSLESTISARYESALSKFGAILGQGIIDAAGRNARVSLAAVSGMPDMRAIIGATLFCQHWHWYPLMHFLAFSLVPTAMLAVDEQGRMPKSVGLALPSDSVAANAYPPPIKPEVVEAPKLVATAILSTTAKAEARAARKSVVLVPAEGTAMDVDSPALAEESKKAESKLETPTSSSAAATATRSSEQAKRGALEPLPNLTRLLPEQWPHISVCTPATGATLETGKFAFVCDPTATTRHRKSAGRIAVVRPIKGAVIGDDDFIPLALPDEEAMPVAGMDTKEDNGKDVAEEEDMVDKSALIQSDHSHS